MQPCHQGIDSAGEIKAKGTTIYTIGYDIYDNGAGTCNAFDFSPERPAMTTESALRAIATSPEQPSSSLPPAS